ncbi:MAG: glutamyl-tRNA reductase [Deltaproteobacteria bacterium]|nr:MAG: glutamyl-tRNA reductase [Deltaproteobacteria bacterium]
MAGDLFVVGVSWRTAPVELRERIAFADGDIGPALAALVERAPIAEAMILSTCNRVEIYGAPPRGAPASAIASATAEVRRFFADARQVSREQLESALYEHVDRDAVAHAFRVASALDSMVVGEAQILGQLKGAFAAAEHGGAVGPVLRRCMQRAFAVAKRVRTETGIARGAANVSSVAVELAARVFGELDGKTVLVVGAGKMSDLAARHLRANGASTVLVTNRSPERARAVAERVDGIARSWEDLEGVIAIADVVISSTGSREPVLTRKLIKRAMRKRRHKPQVICDIAVPRDAEPAVGDIDGVYLFDIDDLQKAVAENLLERARHAQDAADIVDREVEEFCRWLDVQAVVPTIRALRDRFAAIARAEAERVAAGLEHKSPDQRADAVRRLADQIVNKLLHQPMVALKGGGAADVAELARAVRELFALDEVGDDAVAEETAPAADGAPRPAKHRGPA